MSCAEKGQVLHLHTEAKGAPWKVVFLKHDTDGFPKKEVLVVFSGTRHVARVPIKWLRRPKG